MSIIQQQVSLSENITGCTSISMWNATIQTYQTYIGLVDLLLLTLLLVRGYGFIC